MQGARRGRTFLAACSARMARRSAAATRSCMARLASSMDDSDSLDARSVSSIAAASASSYRRVSAPSVLACAHTELIRQPKTSNIRHVT